MKKTLFILSAFLVLMATGCQKEKDNVFYENPLSETSVQGIGVVCYTIDGIAYRVVVKDDAANTALLQQLMDLVQNGHQVSLYREDLCQQNGVTKDVVHFDTKDQKEMSEWAEKMEKDGYNVEIRYEDGVYHGTATKK